MKKGVYILFESYKRKNSELIEPKKSVSFTINDVKMVARNILVQHVIGHVASFRGCVFTDMFFQNMI